MLNCLACEPEVLDTIEVVSAFTPNGRGYSTENFACYFINNQKRFLTQPVNGGKAHLPNSLVFRHLSAIH